MDDLALVQQQIAELQKKADHIAKEKKAAVIKDIKQLIRMYNVTSKELGFDSEKEEVSSVTSKPKKKVKVKYRLGDKTWTGRGIQPKWIKQFLTEGGALSQIEVI